jgi:hypothetical protein
MGLILENLSDGLSSWRIVKGPGNDWTVVPDLSQPDCCLPEETGISRIANMSRGN